MLGTVQFSSLAGGGCVAGPGGGLKEQKSDIVVNQKNIGADHPGGTDAAHGTLLALRGTHQVTLVTVSPHCLLSRAVTTSVLRLRLVTEPPTCLSHFQVAGVVLGGTSAGPGPVRPFSVNWT